MIKLFCAIVDVPGAAFSVRVDEGDTVDDLKKAIKDQKPNDLKYVDADELQLFLAKKGDAWLPDDDPAALALDNGMTHLDVQGMIDGEQMKATWTLEDVLTANNMTNPKSRQIHVLVVAPERDDKRQRLIWKTSSLTAHQYDQNRHFFSLEAEDLLDTGLPSDRKLLYCRSAFHQQFKFLQERVIDNDRCGWILGPPGTGKSTTAMAFVLTLDKSDWVVTWIQLRAGRSAQCVRLVGTEKKTKKFEVSDLVDDVYPGKNHLVVVDGYRANEVGNTTYMQECNDWHLDDTAIMSRRLVFICSMSSRGKIHAGDDKALRVEELSVFSWTRDEYRNALNNAAFFDSVKTNLDSTDALPDSVCTFEDCDPWLESKFYYAGGCCRLMFDFKTAEVIQHFSYAVNSVENASQTALSEVGDRASNVINRLYGLFPDGTSTKSLLVSAFVASLLVLKGGPEMVKKISALLHDASNPSFDGWFLEFFFFTSIRNGGVHLCDQDGAPVMEWPESRVYLCGIDNIPLLSNGPLWLKPEKWNQGGYDAIYIDKSEELVRFVQVTGAHKHSFLLRYFRAYLLALRVSDPSFVAEKVEIYFVVEQAQLRDFKVKDPVGQGLLQEWNWPKGQETDMVQKVGLHGPKYNKENL